MNKYKIAIFVVGLLVAIVSISIFTVAATPLINKPVVFRLIK